MNSQNKPRKLYRPENDKMLGGVCSGLAHYFNIDPTIMRLIYVMFTLITGGIGVFCYLLLWVITPKKLASHTNANAGHVFEHED
jgi:phage shock protein PspC (stress-responsive transcriptional regulator)